MTSRTAVPPTRERLERVASPERIGAALAAGVVLVVAAIVLLSGPSGAGGTALASPSPSADPAASAGPSGGPTSAAGSGVVTSARPSAAPASPSSAVAVPAEWAPIARQLLVADAAIQILRDRLATTDKDTASDDIARDLRAMNTQLVAALSLIDQLDASTAPPEIAGSARDLHQGALDQNRETLRASLQNGDAYVSGAKATVTILADLDTLMVQIEVAAGGPPP